MIKLNLKYFPEEEIQEYYMVQVMAHILVLRVRMANFWHKKVEKLKDVISKQDEEVISIFANLEERNALNNRLRDNIHMALEDAKRNYAKYYFLIIQYSSKKDNKILKMLKYTKLFKIAQEEYKRLTKDWSGVDRAIYGKYIRRVR